MNYIRYKKKPGDDFCLFSPNTAADIYVDAEDYRGVQRAAGDLQSDVLKLSNKKPELKDDSHNLLETAVIIGTIGKSNMINQLIEQGKLDVEGIEGKWESFVLQVVPDPFSGVKNSLVIAGSDKRGTIFGIYDLTKEMGISPWYWWADVTPKSQEKIFIKKGIYKKGEPSVKYRGIFLNDEAPCLTTWVENKFGGFNHIFYEKVFELLLRLKANYLWPAMWKPRMFNEEDPLNPELADKYGIIMGTSHHEPMMRSWAEWGEKGAGEWNYNTNQENIYQFWAKGIERNKDYESIITVGMRGDGDEPMVADGGLGENKLLLEKIIRDQREILADKINSEVTEIPQLLALYKEVQGFYEAGLEVPEDVTLLLSDDNFGNVRILPDKKERERSGGFGIYYHFDYVGGPKSHKWINTTPIQKIWEQMNMAYQYGVDRIWIVNVGDLKPMEYPIDFFLDIAWDINKWDYNNILDFQKKWAEEKFGKEFAPEIAEIMAVYTKFNGRRKPTILEKDTYSLTNYREAEKELEKFEYIVNRAEKIYNKITKEKKDAFYQLVLFPARASMNIMRLKVYTGLNNLYAEQGRAQANEYAQLAQKAFKRDAEETEYYNQELADGKWKGIMIQPHIGQEGWRAPTENTMPEVKTLDLQPGSEMGIAVENSDQIWPNSSEQCCLPEFSPFAEEEKHYIDIFNKRKNNFSYEIKKDKTWIEIDKPQGEVNKQQRIGVKIRWGLLSSGKNNGEIMIKGASSEVKVKVNISNPISVKKIDKQGKIFIEKDNYISLEAEHFAREKSVNGVSWEVIPEYGRTGSSLAIFPPTTERVTSPEAAPYLEYQVYITNPGQVTATVYTAPTLNFMCGKGLKYGISFDQQKKKIIDTFSEEKNANYDCLEWMAGVMINARITSSTHIIEEIGFHTLKFWMVDPGVVLQKIVLDLGGVKPSYLGPPESPFIENKK